MRDLLRRSKRRSDAPKLWIKRSDNGESCEGSSNEKREMPNQVHRESDQCGEYGAHHLRHCREDQRNRGSCVHVQRDRGKVHCDDHAGNQRIMFGRAKTDLFCGGRKSCGVPVATDNTDFLHQSAVKFEETKLLRV